MLSIISAAEAAMGLSLCTFQGFVSNINVEWLAVPCLRSRNPALRTNWAFIFHHKKAYFVF